MKSPHRVNDTLLFVAIFSVLFNISFNHASLGLGTLGGFDDSSPSGSSNDTNGTLGGMSGFGMDSTGTDSGSASTAFSSGPGTPQQNDAPGAPAGPAQPSSDSNNNTAQKAVQQQPLSLSLETKTAQSILSSQSVSPKKKGVVMFTRHTNPAVSEQDLASDPRTAGAQQITFRNKKTVPPAAKLTSKAGLTSFTYIKQKPVPFKPQEGATSNQQLNSLYDSLIKSIETTPGFLPIFRKLHIVALHQIYEYLMGIYSSLNMTHIDDLETYVTLESLYGLNKKTLIINHLVNLIEGQLNQALLALFPQMPQHIATHTGMTCIERDESSRLDLLIVDIERVVFETFKTAGVAPDQWDSVLDGLNNPDYTQFLSKVSSSDLSSIKSKIETFLNKTMDLGGSDDYMQGVRQTYNSPPQSTYFNGSIPSGLAWQKKTEALATQTSDKSKFPKYVSLFKQLSLKERTALIDALDILVAHFSSNQELEDLSTLIPMLKGTDSIKPLNVGQYKLLLNITRNLAFSGPVADEITNIKKLYPEVVSGSSRPLTKDELATINGVVSYLCVRLEKGTADAINQTVAKVKKMLQESYDKLSSHEQKLFKQFSGFTALEQATLQTLATELQQDPGFIDRMTQTNLQTMADGFAAIATMDDTFPSAATRSLFGEIGQAFKKGPPKIDDFSAAQKEAYNQALTHFAAYDPGSYTFTQAEQDMYKIFPQKEAGTYVFDTVTAGLDAADERYLDNKTPSELLMLLGSFQGAGRVVESRIREHTKGSAVFGAIFDTEPELKKALYLAATFEQYANLIGIYQIMNPPDKPLTSFAFSDMKSVTKRKVLADVMAFLVVPDAPAQSSSAGNASTSHADTTQHTKGYLEQIQALHLQDATMQAIVSLVNNSNYDLVQGIFNKVQQFNFDLSHLDDTEKKFLATALETYQTELLKNPSAGHTKIPSSQTATKGLDGPSHPLSQEDEINMSAVAPMLHAYTHLQQMQQDFLKTLGQYLNFFCPYTAALHDGAQAAASSTINTQYLGLTEFSDYAQSVAKKVREAKGADGKPLDISDMNPPLFFYNKETLRAIDLIPYLAQSVEGTHNAPYPTLAVDAALSTDPTSSDAKKSNLIILSNGAPITVPSLTVSAQGSTFSPKFFFKDEYGNAFANSSDLQFGTTKASNAKGKDFVQEVATNAKLPWLEKRTVPTQDPSTNYTYIYTPAFNGQGNRVAPKGEEGLYMNIPVTMKDPNDSSQLLVRLYEQPILPQPDWLNSEEGVIRMLRVCLGDFTTGLTLNEPVFDACLQLIFRQALATLSELPSGLAPGQSIDTSQETVSRLSQECHLHLVREYIDQNTRQQASEEIAAGQ